MAKKPCSFKVDNIKKTITLYTNIEQPEAEKTLITFYLTNGYAPLTALKEKGITVAEMLEELEADETALEEFKKKYKEKGGFHKACKVYTDWKKKNK